MTALALVTPSLRLFGDAFWVVAFAGSLIWLLARAGGSVGEPAEGVLLELRPGLQQQALLRGGERVGSVQLLTRRLPQGWLLERRVRLGDRQIAVVRQELRVDLSLARLSLTASLDDLAGLLGVSASPLRMLGARFASPRLHMRKLDGLGALSLDGPCQLETGSCSLVGRLGDRSMRFPVFPGRGPVLTAAVYPLLARGRLGRDLELSLFDPLALRPQRVTLRVLGRESLLLPAGRVEALRVRVELEGGPASEVWLDRDGMPLREELPLGLRADHEWWRPDE